MFFFNSLNIFVIDILKPHGQFRPPSDFYHNSFCCLFVSGIRFSWITHVSTLVETRHFRSYIIANLSIWLLSSWSCFCYLFTCIFSDWLDYFSKVYLFPFPQSRKLLLLLLKGQSLHLPLGCLGMTVVLAELF